MTNGPGPEYLVAQMDFSKATFLKEPYPIGLATEVFHGIPYAAMVMGFPPLSLLPYWGSKKDGSKAYHKHALNERMEGFHEYLTEHPIWWAFHNSIKKPEFPEFIFSVLRGQGITIPPSRKWHTRFEFAAMPANGGYIVPHTDLSSKVVTLVFSIVTPGDWESSWGGGTDVLLPKDPTAKLKSYEAPLDAFEVVHTYEYLPNQCVIFFKTDNSWHSVGPIKGPKGELRRTITLNIEKMDG